MRSAGCCLYESIDLLTLLLLIRYSTLVVEWAWQQPWQCCKQEKTYGSGFVISHGRRNRILTNSHVIASAIDIRVRLHGSPRRFPAHVVTYAPDVDLALLEIEKEHHEEFFGGKEGRESSLALDFAPELPALQERVNVVGTNVFQKTGSILRYSFCSLFLISFAFLGFPTGGRTVCVTEGVVSRIDDLFLAPPGDIILSIQIDAAINGGNSGGPAFNSKVCGLKIEHGD